MKRPYRNLCPRQSSRRICPAAGVCEFERVWAEAKQAGGSGLSHFGVADSFLESFGSGIKGRSQKRANLFFRGDMLGRLSVRDYRETWYGNQKEARQLRVDAGSLLRHRLQRWAFFGRCRSEFTNPVPRFRKGNLKEVV